jgi:hypothetical protein
MNMKNMQFIGHQHRSINIVRNAKIIHQVNYHNHSNFAHTKGDARTGTRLNNYRTQQAAGNWNIPYILK